MKLLLTYCFLALSLLSFSQIPNNGFENWTNDPRPIDWDNNSYPQTLPSFEPYIVRQDTDAYVGDYSAQLFANGVFKAYAISTFPVVFHPNYLTAVVKVDYPPCVNDVNYPEKDTVSIKVELLYNGAVVDQGYWHTLTSNFTWTQVTIPISQTSNLFDSCRITLLGGKVNQGGCGIIAATTKFNVDHLQVFYGQSANCIDSSIINPLVFCPGIYSPVCGCNGITYNNDCEAYYMNGVTSWNNGPCDNQTSCIDSSLICDTCACFTVYNPVCGCNGITYSNSCFANIAGVTAFTPGPCGQQGCIDPNQIDTTVICMMVIDPVCGCDGVTYNNACEAENWYGITNWTQGPCSAQPDTCNALFYFGKSVDTVNFFNNSTGLVLANWHWDFGDGNTSNQQNPTHIYAQDGNYMVCLTISGTTAANTLCSDTFCSQVYITHNCVDTSLICDPPHLCCDAPLFEPVCGCDSITYDNACIAALLHGVTHTTLGPCAFNNIKNLNNAFSLLVMPVPAYDKLTVNYHLSSQSTIQLTVVSSIGQIIKNTAPGLQPQGKHTLEIDIADMPAGVYMLEIKNEAGERSIRKFVKQ